jgi:hypothetical protein
MTVAAPFEQEISTMSVSHGTEVDVARAQAIWADYQRQHDVSDRKGQAVGIDPVSGRVWFGARAIDIARQMRAEGIERPFYCVRVGSVYYGHKGGRR